MITIQELLYNRGLDRTARVKLVRHKDRRVDLYNMYKTNRKEFLDYQNTQSKDIFKDVDYIVSFIGEDGVLARFVGVYKVESKTLNAEEYKYTMSEVAGYEDLKERVIIRWGNAISWHQWIKNEKEVIEISPGLHYKSFADYFDFILDFNELCEIVKNNYADWRRALSAVKGIYLINDTNTGKLYIGSAYGEDGLWGRWSEYVATGGHSGNKTLRALVAADGEYAYKYFQFSILMLLPKTVTPDEVIRKEQLFKCKLGTNSFGLNNN